jgi:hypothetical protein
MGEITIAQLLLRDKIISQEHLEQANQIQKKSGGLVEMILVKQGYLTPQNLTKYMKMAEDKQKEAGISDSQPKKLRLGEILVQAGEITEEQVSQALEYQKKHGVKIGIAFVDLEIISRQVLVKYLTKQSQMVIDSMSLLNYEATDIVSEVEKK